MHPLAKLDRRYAWHPFTQMRDWLKREPIVIVEGKGAQLWDAHGHEYLDANSSIWTNLHGHNHPRINAAIRGQLSKIAHSSALGLANEPASLLARKLVEAAPPALRKVFFSDNGSTAMEVALKLAYEFARRTSISRRPKFLTLEGAYHGDTVGAVALGHIDLFHKAYSGLLFKTDKVMAPYCYRCPFNRARPERADAREYRKCNWECLGKVEQKFAARKKRGNPYAGFVFEPLMQGAAGMIPQPAGWLSRATEIARAYGALLIADEVMTGFGRTGMERSENTPEEGVRRLMGESSGRSAMSIGKPRQPNQAPAGAACRSKQVRDAAMPLLAELGDSLVGRQGYTLAAADGAKLSGQRSDLCEPDLASGKRGTSSPSVSPPPPLFACQQEGVQPDLLALAKGLTGGYLPMAATLTTEAVFDAFLGEYEEFKTFFHGHSFTGNQLGAAAGLASVELLENTASIRRRRRLEQGLRDELKTLWSCQNVGDIRQVGLIAGIELVRDWRTREPFDLRERAGIRVCDAMARRGVLTRPIGNVLVLMPPYCTTPAQIRRMVRVLKDAIQATCAAKW